MYQKARSGYTILEFVSEEKCPRFCLCRRPLLFFGHFLQRNTPVSVSHALTSHVTTNQEAPPHLVMHITTATMMAICMAPMMAAMRM